ncbi:MAG: hypothetical protein ACFFC7_07165 [Candidatus Hermodarchaeota archaeon]
MSLNGRLRIPVLSVEFKSQETLMRFISAICQFHGKLSVSLSYKNQREILTISNGSDLIEIYLSPATSTQECRQATIYIIDVPRTTIHNNMLSTIKNDKEIHLIHVW